jgi:hypothetical protein
MRRRPSTWDPLTPPEGHHARVLPTREQVLADLARRVAQPRSESLGGCSHVDEAGKLQEGDGECQRY